MNIVVALGGNSLTLPYGKGNYQELLHNVQKVVESLAMLAQHHQLVVVSGSGPQIGALLLQNELAKKQVVPSPLDILDAELEGELGYVLQQSFLNVFRKNRQKHHVVTLLTQVRVNPKDPAFTHPSKPVGPFYSKTLAQQLHKKKKWTMIEDSGRGYRRVVPSPQPLQIVEIPIIKRLIQSNVVVIAAGGGGIPVVQKRGRLEGVEAVIDKDLASAKLAADIHADELLILTGVPCVYLDYGSKTQRPVRKMTVLEAKRHMMHGQFPEGSMGPKIEAAIQFLKHGGKKVIITSPEHVEKALKGKSGTEIVASS